MNIWAFHFNADPAVFAVALTTAGRVENNVLAAQFFSDLLIGYAQIFKAFRQEDAPASLFGNARQILLAVSQCLQMQLNAVEFDLVERVVAVLLVKLQIGLFFVGV